jgi:acetyl-CoA carboxylase biotin carboxylase subunit
MSSRPPGSSPSIIPPAAPACVIDTHIYAGYNVPPFYDSMIAKVICQGTDRAEALMRMRNALEMFVVQGVTTTIPFLARLMQDKYFQAGDIHTKFLEKEGAGLLKTPE